MTPPEFLRPDWPAPVRVRALVTTRVGGVGREPYDSFNLGDHVGDDPVTVAENRARLRLHLPDEPLWLSQVHGTRVADADRERGPVEADASVARTVGRVCAVLTADCLPVLLCDREGAVVAAAHAGWRGLRAGVLEATVAAMEVDAGRLMAWLGPAIGPTAFEVGEEVRAAFLATDAAAETAFSPGAVAGKWWADLPRLARLRLAAAGVTEVYGGDRCTVTEAHRFYSYRRDRVTGRMATLVWLSDETS